ncbi:LANO_0F01310g1_1 [Lachancea nothofagi CBS 11611]|uniref:LANO_0F01310g1_1 n=1 Tax=Lachancea nothofagi CBS 11611 TaxID=1266666 RepID=A0A1G4K613_9SACH|nr:LANO_0F01310g1_1 [Lachancea nothofagi CBS 11611]
MSSRHSDSTSSSPPTYEDHFGLKEASINRGMLKASPPNLVRQFFRGTSKPASDQIPTRIKLTDLKSRGTLIKHTTSAIPNIEYNTFSTFECPYNTVHESPLLDVSLEMDTDTVCLQGLNASSVTGSHPNIDCEQPQSNGLVSGKLRITVKGANSILLNNVQVRLSGYSCEYVCNVGNPSEVKVVKLLNSPRSRSQSHISYQTPFIQDVIQFNLPGNEHPSDSDQLSGLVLLPPGTYDYKFEFIVDSKHFPASVATHYGSTAYRVESFVTVPKRKSKFETVMLTSRLLLKKTLSPDYIDIQESLSTQSTWRNGMLDYDIFLSSRLLEFDTPFQMSLQLIKKSTEQFRIKFVKITLEQKCSIPCVDRNSGAVVEDINSLVTTASLEFAHNFNENDLCHNLTMNDLKASSSLKKAIYNDSFFPFYEEPSSNLAGATSEIFKLRISHEIKIKIGIEVKGSKGWNNEELLALVLRIPVLLVDQNMGVSAQLPKYEPKSLNSRPIVILECQSESSILTPPEYDKIGEENI